MISALDVDIMVKLSQWGSAGERKNPASIDPKG